MLYSHKRLPVKQPEEGEVQTSAMPSPTGFLITFCIGVAATLTWQSYGDAARESIASSYPQLGWLAPQPPPTVQNAPDVIALAAPAAPSPDQQQLNAMSLDAVLQSIGRIATGIAASEEQITRSADRIAISIGAGQEQMTRSIEGRGLPANFELHSAPGLGMRIVRAFSQQLNASIEVHRLDPGAEFVVTAPSRTEVVTSDRTILRAAGPHRATISAAARID
jgi:hypothetical protein